MLLISVASISKPMLRKEIKRYLYSFSSPQLFKNVSPQLRSLMQCMKENYHTKKWSEKKVMATNWHVQDQGKESKMPASLLEAKMKYLTLKMNEPLRNPEGADRNILPDYIPFHNLRLNLFL